MQTKLPSCEASENGQKWQKNSWIRISGYRTSQNVIVYWSQAQKCHENSSILLSKPAGEPTDKLRKKQNRMVANKTRNTFRRTRNLSSATFSLLITWRSSRSKSAAVYKISSKSNDFSLRYGDISILKMAAVRHLGIVLPPYETTPSLCCWPQLPVKFHVNLIHRSEFFTYLAWNACRPPKWKFWGTLDP